MAETTKDAPRKYAQKLIEKNRCALKELGFESNSQLDALSYAILSSLSEFLAITLPQEKTELFSQIITEYERLIKGRAAEKVVKVETAVPLTENEKKELKESLKRIIDGDFRLEEKVNRKITGGMIIKAGHKVIDQSLKYKLDKFRKSLGS